MKELYNSHESYVKKMCFSLIPRQVRVFIRLYWQFVLTFTQVALLQEGTLLYKLQYFSI
jgi:hypothetical protein